MQQRTTPDLPRTQNHSPHQSVQLKRKSQQT
jgi:hypothetical protein